MTSAMPAKISIEHRIMGAVPCIAGRRIPLQGRRPTRPGQGHSIDGFLADYSTHTCKDILAALQCAANIVDERELPLGLAA